MRRIILLVCFVLCLLLGTGMTAEDAAASEPEDMEGVFTYSEGIENGVLYYMKFEQFVSIVGCDTTVTKVTIPEEIDNLPVKNVKSNTFSGCTVIETAVINVNISSDFRDASPLKEVYIGRNVSSFNEGAMDMLLKCSNLKKIEVDPENDRYMSIDGVMYTKDKKTLVKYPAGKEGAEFKIPSEVNTLNQNSFRDNQHIEFMHIPENVTAIGDSAFLDTKALEAVTIPGSVSLVGNYAFCSGDSLKTIIMSNGITEIGQGAFEANYYLEEIAFPESIKTIGNEVLFDCRRLRKVSLSSNVEFIGSRVFVICADMDRQVTVYCDEGSIAWEYVMNLADDSIITKPLTDSEAPKITEMEEQYIDAADCINASYGDKNVSIGAKAFADEDGETVETGAKIEYTSRDPEVAKVDEDGNVSFGLPGETVIELVANQTSKHRKAYHEIRVSVEKATQTITGPNSVSKTFEYNGKFSVEGDALTSVSYTSSDSRIASVDSDGTVTMKNPGSATIYQTASENQYYKPATKKVTVRSYLKKPTLYVKAYNGRKIKITWSQVPGAHGYRLYLYSSSSKRYVYKLSRNATVKSIYHKGLKRGKIYKYKVRAYRKVNGSIVYSSCSDAKWARARR